jgi:two-component system, NarL family, response regulator NreC
MAEAKIRLLVADDHSILRHGLRLILEAEPDMTVVGEAANGIEAVKRARQLKPDIVIMDISMPEQDGIQSLQQMIKTVRSHVLILSVHLEYQMISQAVSAGAHGYLAKDSLDTELIAAVRTIAQGGTVFSPNVLRLLANTDQRRIAKPNSQSLHVLTAREREVFLLLAEGNTPSKVAKSLIISPKTVHTHRLHVLEKLGLSTTTELIRFALRERLIQGV